MKQDNTQRVDKYLSSLGYCSRRKVAEFLKANKVMVKGQRVTESGYRFDPQTDKLTVGGKKTTETELVYYIVNKPVDYVSTVADEHGRKSVLDLLPPSITKKYRLYPVGRLDIESSGLVLLTNDGDLAYSITHPKHHVPKKYRLKILGSVKSGYLNLFRRGVRLKDGVTAPTEVKKLDSSDDYTVLEMTLHEGRNRQIRRMCKSLNLNLMSLKRNSIGSIRMKDLASGKFRELLPKEIESLKSETQNK